MEYILVSDSFIKKVLCKITWILPQNICIIFREKFEGDYFLKKHNLFSGLYSIYLSKLYFYSYDMHVFVSKVYVTKKIFLLRKHNFEYYYYEGIKSQQTIKILYWSVFDKNI